MGDRKKTKNSPATELKRLRARVRQLEKASAEYEATCQALTAGERRYRALVDLVGEGIGIVDENECFVFANPAAERAFGVAPDALVGRSVSEFVDRETYALLRRQTELRRRGEPSEYEIEIIRPDGEMRHLAITATPRFDEEGGFSGTVGIFREVTEEKELKDALMHSAQQWRATFDALGNGVCLVDADNRILRCNVAMTKLFGKPFPEILGRTGDELFAGAAAPKLSSLVEIVRQSRSRETAQLRLRDRWYEVVCDPLLNEEQELIGATVVFSDFTDRRRAEEALRQSEERYRTLHANVLAGVYRSTPEGQLISVNPALVRMLGYDSADELMGTFTLDTYVIRAHREEFVGRLEADGVVTDYEVPLRRRDGSNVWVSLSAKAVKDEEGRTVHYDGIMEDISARKQAEEELRRRTSQLEVLREVGLEITAELEREALLRSIVSRAVQLLECSSGTFYVYRSDQDLLERGVYVGPHREGEAHWIHRGEGLAGKLLEDGAAVIRNAPEAGSESASESEPVPGSTVGVPVTWREEFLGVLTVAAESPRTFSESDAEQLGLLATQAAIAVRNARLVGSLRELNEFKDAVMGIVAHDLRGPLTHMTGFLDLLAKDLGELTDRQDRWLGIIRGAVLRMEELIKGILSYRRLTLEGEIKREPCDLNEIASTVAGESESAAVQKSHGLTVSPAPEELRVLGDDLLLREAVGNLLSNAIKYTPPGGTITVRAEGGDGEAGILVVDTGPGIDEQDQNRLFQPFVRLKSAGSEKGVGLGLSLVKTIIERHGGRLTVESTVGSGSTFGFWLPTVDDHDTPPASPDNA
jgi:PAS domain S-box-containing protein